MENMQRTKQAERPEERALVVLVKCLLAAYLLTGGALLLLALLLYRLQLSEQIVNIGIIVIYALACLAAGFLSGKRMRSRRFFWGLLSGLFYFVILSLVTLAVNRSFQDLGNQFFTTLMICVGSGMLGGMIS